jgi:hypothetical protein
MYILLFGPCSNVAMCFGSRGCYRTTLELSKAVDYWANRFPQLLLAYEEWEMNNYLEPHGWDFCFIPLNFDRQMLVETGGIVPDEKFWGKNLIRNNNDMNGWQSVSDTTTILFDSCGRVRRINTQEKNTSQALVDANKFVGRKLKIEGFWFPQENGSYEILVDWNV